MLRVAPILLVVGLLGASAVLFGQPGDGKPVWHSDWRTAQRLARQENKPIFAVLVCRH